MKTTKYCIKILFLLALMVGTVSSCSEDLGNYDYKDLPEVEIEGLQTPVTALAFQELSIPIELKGLQADEGRYEYEWMVIKQFEPEGEDEPREEVIATTKDLNEFIVLDPGPYKLLYTVTDKQLDVYYQKQTDLSVITTTSEGWVVLCSENGNVRLDMISNVLEEQVHTKDILADSDIPFKKGPISIIQFSPEGKWDEDYGIPISAAQVDPTSPFYLLTEEGTTRLHKTSFKWEEEYLFKYEMGDLSDTKVSHIAAAGSIRMITTDNGTFVSDYTSGATLFGSSSNYYRSEDNEKQFVNVAPYVGANITNPMHYAQVFMFYDKDNKCFAYHPDGMYLGLIGSTTPVGLIPMSDAEAGGSAFSFPQGQDFVYMENSGRIASISMLSGAANNITYTILEEDGVYHLYGIALDDYYMALFGMSAYSKVSYANLVNCTDILQAEHFAFSPLNNQFFYAVGNKVYRVNFNEVEPSSELQFELDGEITCLKFHLFNNPENSSRSNDLIVASDKGGVEGGEIRIYDAENVLEKITTPKIQLSGFAKVVDIIYKESIS